MSHLWNILISKNHQFLRCECFARCLMPILMSDVFFWNVVTFECSTIRSSLGGQVWLEWTIIHLKRGTSRLLLPYMVACLICCITVKIKHASLLFLVDTTITYGHHFLRIAGRQRLNIARKALFYIFLNTCICCTFINDCWLLHLNVSLNRQLNLGLKRKLNIVPPN